MCFINFGMGCRSVSKLLVPNDYDFDLLFNAFYEHKEIINHNRYANNYDYNKAIYLMSEQKFIENGFIIVKRKIKNLDLQFRVYFMKNTIQIMILMNTLITTKISYNASLVTF